MAKTCPVWLDARYLQNVLRNVERDDSIQVSEMDLKPATVKGDNYASDLYRVAVNLSRIQDGTKIAEKISLVVKIALDEESQRGKFIAEGGLFVTELSLFHTVLPRMNKLLEKLCPATPLSARCLHIQHEKPTHAILEDLATTGFRMAARYSGLDFDHCLLAMQNLGRFHASSVALQKEEPDVLSNYSKGMYRKDAPAAFQVFFNSRIKSFATEVAKWSELSPEIAKKITKLSSGALYQKACEACEFSEDEFTVLNHGDCWINNMMFRYDETQRPIDHIFVDFQMSHRGSPAEDIHYFFGSSPSDDVRIHHRVLLLHEYYASLVTTMKQLKCKRKPLSFAELGEALKMREIYEAIVAMTLLSTVTLEKGKEIDFSKSLNVDVVYDNPGYRSNTYRNIMTRLLPIYDRNGFLDV